MGAPDRQLHAGRWRAYLNDCATLADFVEPMQVSGRVTRVAGLVMEAVGLRLAVGAACTVPLPSGGKVEAEVVGRGAGAHDEHGVDEQQAAAAVESPALLHRERDGAKNNREPARGYVDG